MPRVLWPLRRHVPRVLAVLAVVTWTLTAVGVLSAAVLRDRYLADKVLPWNPRYALAMEAWRKLQDMHYPLKIGSDPVRKVGVVTIGNPAWGVLLDFLQSQTAIEKSERGTPLIKYKKGSGTTDSEAHSPPNRLVSYNGNRVYSDKSANSWRSTNCTSLQTNGGMAREPSELNGRL